MEISTTKVTNHKNLKYVCNLVFREIQPLFREIVEKVELLKKSYDKQNYTLDKIWDVCTLCIDQMKKCVLIFIEIFDYKKEHKIFDQDSLECILQRLSCCHQKLQSIDSQVDALFDTHHSITDESINTNTMYFVNWIDQTFDILNNLSNIIYQTDYKNSETNLEKWKDELVMCVSGIHTCIDEMLLSAMTLCKYCLPTDQHIVKARCQVVLRETKALLSDLINGDLDSVFQASKESLILPIKPSNINVLIDVLKDVMYALETNTNTALLALLVHCFAYNKCPVDKLKAHFKEKGGCECDKECDFVKEFDLYNERLMQIGSFAISCSSDENRVLSLRSGLASLEALDPHLVPALMVASSSFNASLLVNIWKREVADIKNKVFLIVDPTAFVQKVKQMMHSSLLEVIKEKSYNNAKVCAVINMSCVLSDFFQVYRTNELEALTHQDKLLPLLHDLDKVIPECKIVSNTLTASDDFQYETNSKCPNAVTIEQLIKRLKLLYTIANKMSTLLSPEEDMLEETMGNGTFTVAKKTMNLTKTMFRTTNIKSSTAKFPLAKLTKSIKFKKDLSFSIKLDQLCDISEIKVRNTSILYSPLKKGSLRKAVLSRMRFEDLAASNQCFEEEMLSLQITDVLNEINSLTGRPRMLNLTYDDGDAAKDVSDVSVTEINNRTVNKGQLTGNLSTDSYPSDVGTLERINDLNVVTSRLGELKFERKSTKK